MKRHLFSVAILLAASPIVSGQTGKVGIGTTSPTEQFHTTGSVRLQGYSGIGSRVVYADEQGRLQTYGALSTNTFAISIPDTGCNSGLAGLSGITVTNQPTSIPTSKVAVRINITHPYVGDVRVYLVVPGAGVIPLVLNAGGNGQNFSGTIFSDEGAGPISGSAPFSGIYKPSGDTSGQHCGLVTNLTSFAAISPSGVFNPNGTWLLRVYDNAAGDIGNINNWSLSLSGPGAFAAADSRNFIPRTVDGALLASKIFQEPAGAGRIGINTTSPQAQLDVAGALRVHDSARVEGALKFSAGSPATGKVLTAVNAAGDAEWRAPVQAGTGFRVFASAALSVASNASQIVPFNNTANGGFDDGANFNATTNSYVAPSAGVYQFSVHVGCIAGSYNAVTSVSLRALLNGSSASNLPEVSTPVSTANGQTITYGLQLSFTAKLAAGDQIKIQLTNNTAVQAAISGFAGYTQFSGSRIY